MSVAFHPSGHQLVVGFVDRIRMMNVFARNLKTYKEISVKACREIRFSNGGHLFALANQYQINVYRFFTADCPSEYIFKEHTGKVKSLYWLDDDSGFISAGLDGALLVWRLNVDALVLAGEKPVEKNPISRFDVKNTRYNDIVIRPSDSSKPIVFAVTDDR